MDCFDSLYVFVLAVAKFLVPDGGGGGGCRFGPPG